MRRQLTLLVLLLAPVLGRTTFGINEDLIDLNPAWQVLAIVAGTLISEDAVCIAVGTLIGRGKMNWVVGGVGCFIGIYIGDLLFFLIGRALGRRVLLLRFFTRSLGEERLRRFGDWFDRRPWAAIGACRVLPGLRVPLYVTVGALSRRTAAFFWWTCVFAFVWTPLLIVAVAFMGDRFSAPFKQVLGQGWVSIVLQIVMAYLLVRFVILMSTAAGRKTLARRFTWPVRWMRGRATPQREGEPELAAEADALLSTDEAKR